LLGVAEAGYPYRFAFLAGMPVPIARCTATIFGEVFASEIGKSDTVRKAAAIPQQ
jgi:hypothetical protein